MYLGLSIILKLNWYNTYSALRQESGNPQDDSETIVF